MRRIYTIDYLRGLLALSVVLYHFSGWAHGGGQDVSTILGKLGIYAVSGFFVISGISIYLSYHNCIWDRKTTTVFFVRRFLRLAPGYWVATLLVIIYNYISKDNYSPDWPVYFNNFTLLFGFFNPTKYMVTGGWSIGVEVVFYAMFPVMVILFKNKIGMYVVLILSLVFYLLFGFLIINVDADIPDVWKNYINPFNQVALFVGGMLIAKYLHQIKRVLSQKISLSALTFFMLIFIFYPVSGHWVEIITGMNRVWLTLITILIVLFLAATDYPQDMIFGKILTFFGDISYSLYLLHGVLFWFFRLAMRNYIDRHIDINITLVSFCVILPASILLSFLLHKFVETKFIRYGKAMTSVGKVNYKWPPH